MALNSSGNSPTSLIERYINTSYDIVTAVSNNISSVVAVDGGLPSVVIVATDIANVNLVAPSIANVNFVGPSIANVNIVATDIANVNLVGPSIANVNLVGPSIANVNLVGPSITNVNTVATNIADINTVETEITNGNITLAIAAPALTEADKISASNWANYAEDSLILVGDGGNGTTDYSAYHWSKKAETSATGSLIYVGVWDASGGTFPTGPVLGRYYKISVAGTISPYTLAIGDSILYNGTDWDKIDNTEQVTSVAGVVGAVTAAQLKAQYILEAKAFTDAQYDALALVEASATADQTGAEIKTAYELEADTNAYTDAEKTQAALQTGTNTGDVAPTKTLTALTDAAATLTGAQLKGGLFTITPTIARIQTTDTATAIVAAMVGSVDNDSFEFTVINLAAFDVTLAIGTGVTIVGSAIINNGSATWIARRLTSTTVALYRT